MKWIPSGFKFDVVEFTLFDLLKLALGRELKSGALIARCAIRARGKE
jgi:hypothetical protein